MPWHSFKDVANKHLKKSGLEHKVHQATIIDKANALLVEWFGNEAATKAQAIYLHGPVVVIAVLDENIAFYLQTREKDFVGALNSLLEQRLISGVILLK